MAKSDQKPAVMAIVKEVARVRALQGGGRFIIENSPVGSTASNGIVERAIQWRLRRESCWTHWKQSGKLVVSYSHPVIGFLVEYAGGILAEQT